jgi:hypothetical protein
MYEEVDFDRRRYLGIALINPDAKGAALITGASSGIGAIYVDRLANRGYDLILVARNRERLDALAARLVDDTGRSVKAIVADLNDNSDLARIEQLLRIDERITMLVNNAGIGVPLPFLDSDIERVERMINLNVIALTRLTRAVASALVNRGGGTIINIASVAAIAPEVLNGVYGATKAFVLAFSLALDKEFASQKIRVQVVLLGATATDFWDAAGTPLEGIPSRMVMKAGDMVDAAIAGLDRGELVTIPSLPDFSDWDAYEAARQNMIPKLSLSSPASRYGVPPARPHGRHPPEAALSSTGER